MHDEIVTALRPGDAVFFGGNRVARVSPALASAFQPGDRLIVVQSSGALLHIPASEAELADRVVASAAAAFAAMTLCSDGQISTFFEMFACNLDDEARIAPIMSANAADVASATARGRSTTRLVLSPQMRAEMIAGLRGWRDAPFERDVIVDTVDHSGWKVQQRSASLGVVGFVFEGRPNVFADATGVLRSGNTVVLRIGSDALSTARAIMTHALVPAIESAGLPLGAVGLVDSPSHAAGYAMFSHGLLALAVARGAGETVEQLGSVARQSGIPVSLHGTGGAWMMTGAHADAERLSLAVEHSLDRKVCNTLNVMCVLRARVGELMPIVLAAAQRAAAKRDTVTKLHVARGSEIHVPTELFTHEVKVKRADGAVDEPHAELIEIDDLGREWEWEGTPELSIVVIDSVQQGVEMFNRLSPRLVASLISDDKVEQDAFWETVDAPFVGNGFTRWVDGQYALGKPELGLSNWQHGRLLARSAVLTGSSVFTVRTKVTQTDPHVHR